LPLNNYCIKDRRWSKESAYLGLQNMPGIKFFRQAFIKILRWEHRAVTGGSLAISKDMGVISNIFRIIKVGCLLRFSIALNEKGRYILLLLFILTPVRAKKLCGNSS
jgi:hypothetical protein